MYFNSSDILKVGYILSKVFKTDIRKPVVNLHP